MHGQRRAIVIVEAAQRALDAGASFLVMPHTDPALVAWVAGQGTPAYPGAATPTEILAAWRAGAAAVKVGLGSRLIGDGVARGVAERAGEVVRAVAHARRSQSLETVTQ